MTQSEILKGAIKKAEANGLAVRSYWTFSPSGNITRSFPRNFEEGAHVIFSHDFAKSFFGYPHKDDGIYAGLMHWEYQLQQMVLEEHPIYYLKKFL